MINVIACAQCGKPSGSGDNIHKLQGKEGFVCHECHTGKPMVKKKKNSRQKFTRWICKRHNCGSYNFGNLVRHEMDWCDIVFESSSLIKKPGTFGGFNGNVGRHYFKDWNEYCVDKQRQEFLVNAYNKWSEKKSRRKRNAHRSR